MIKKSNLLIHLADNWTGSSTKKYYPETEIATFLTHYKMHGLLNVVGALIRRYCAFSCIFIVRAFTLRLDVHEFIQKLGECGFVH